MSHVYVISTPAGLCKVGVSNAPRARLATIATACPYPVRLAWAIDVGERVAKRVEKRAHCLLRDVRWNGEWFACTTSEAIQAVVEAALNPQSIITPLGEELVILSKRAYDQINARLGDEDAEDRMTERLVAEGRARIASGEEGLVRAGPDGRPPKPEEHLPTGARLRAVRRSFGRSQVELANDAGITQGYLSDIETGRKNPTRDVVERIAKALGIEPDTL